MGINHTKDIFENEGRDWRTPSHKFLALVMAYNCDRRGIIRQSHHELADQVLLSTRQVARLIDDLCDMNIIARLGHGRYGIRFGLPHTGTGASGPNLRRDLRSREGLPRPKGADAEAVRIQGILDAERAADESEHVLVWRRDGWPEMMRI